MGGQVMFRYYVIWYAFKGSSYAIERAFYTCDKKLNTSDQVLKLEEHLKMNSSEFVDYVVIAGWKRLK